MAEKYKPHKKLQNSSKPINSYPASSSGVYTFDEMMQKQYEETLAALEVNDKKENMITPLEEFPMYDNEKNLENIQVNSYTKNAKNSTLKDIENNKRGQQDDETVAQNFVDRTQFPLE